MYSSLFAVSVVAIKVNWIYMPILVILCFFMAFDLTLVVCGLFFKVKNGMDYIAINHHVYQVAPFKKPYLKAKTQK
jgi:ABC-type polysaccharide/polyol phosphate export permease